MIKNPITNLVKCESGLRSVTNADQMIEYEIGLRSRFNPINRGEAVLRNKVSPGYLAPVPSHDVATSDGKVPPDDA